MPQPYMCYISWCAVQPDLLSAAGSDRLNSRLYCLGGISWSGVFVFNKFVTHAGVAASPFP